MNCWSSGTLSVLNGMTSMRGPAADAALVIAGAAIAAARTAEVSKDM